jgi:hypothetical protein
MKEGGNKNKKKGNKIEKKSFYTTGGGHFNLIIFFAV